MFSRLTILFLAFVFGTTVSIAQVKHSISGKIKEGASGENMVGATVSILGQEKIAVSSNDYGFYSIALPAGRYTLVISYVGYEQQLVEVDLAGDVVKDIALNEENSLEEVVVTRRQSSTGLGSAAMGTEVLNMKEVEKIPVVFGERDLVKTIQLLPGVKSNGEGSNGFSVRGGSTDQNLILLDEAPVYNASHLLGMFSTFNSDAIKDVTIIKGSSPAQFGGRLSSVLDVKMKDGNNQDYQVSGGIGLISSRLTLEGPIQRGRSSFMVSGRRTYADLFARMSPDFKDVKLYFYDLNAKANVELNERNKLYFSGYFGKDVLAVSNMFGSDWGNSTATLRWNSVLNSRWFSNSSLIYSNYDFNVGFQSAGSSLNFNSNIKDINIKQDITFYLNSNNTIRFGFNTIHHNIAPTAAGGTDIVATKNRRKGLESAIFVSNSQKLDRLTMDYGVRMSMYNVLGGDVYNIYADNELTESIALNDGQFGKTYLNLEPRACINYRINPVSAIKAGYARNTQHLHMLSNSTAGNPTDQWIGNSYNIKPGIADQLSIGYLRNLRDNAYEVGAEIYYKDMKNQIDFRDGVDINTAPDIERELLFGKGRAYGIELLLKKKKGRLTGWLGYTLSKTERQIDGINNGAWYNAKQDRTHDLSLVGIYTLSPAWSLSGTFIYSTGNAVTFPTGKYILNDMTVYQYGDRNADRVPATHRFDLSATYEKPSQGRYQSSWSFGLYNVYGQQNPFSITFRENKADQRKIDAVQSSLFRWVPSVTYNFKF